MSVQPVPTQEPLVSVVVITYNAAEYVGHAIESVLQQSLRELELIVVDDGSTDATPSVIAQFCDDRLSYVRQENRGPNAARNEGIRRARGRFIAFLDCDDWWLPDKLSRQVERASQREQIGLVYSFATRVDSDGATDTAFHNVVEGQVLERLLRGQCISGSASSAMVTRRAVDAVGMFDESLHYAEDWEYWIRVAAQFEVACVPEVDVYLLNRPGSQGKNAGKTLEHSLQFIRGSLRRYAPGRPWFHREALAELYYVASYNFWASGNIWAARRQIFRSIIYNPVHLTYYKRMVRLFFPKRR